jgi:hypothetical protein
VQNDVTGRRADHDRAEFQFVISAGWDDEQAKDGRNNDAHVGLPMLHERGSHQSDCLEVISITRSGIFTQRKVSCPNTDRFCITIVGTAPSDLHSV